MTGKPVKEKKSKKSVKETETKRKQSDHSETGEDKFNQFKAQHKKTWLWFNLIAIFLSIGCAIGTFFVLRADEPNCIVGSLTLALWLVFALHLINVVEFFFNLTGLESKVCSGTMMCGYLIFEVTVLVYMQVIYFESKKCAWITPLKYFWLMG